LEEQAAAYITSHHKALALIGQRLELELLREHPLTFAWLKYPLESLLHWLFGLGNKWVFRMAHARTMANWQKFFSRRREQAIPKLAAIIRQAEAPLSEKHFAAETLGIVAGRPFHLDPKPVQ